MSFFTQPTINVDKWSICPLYGIPVGAATAISNTGKALKDLWDVDMAGARLCRAKLQKNLSQTTEFSAAFSKATQSFWHHLTCIVIGILRMIPLGGLICWAYHQHQAKQLMTQADLLCQQDKHEEAVEVFRKVIVLNGSQEAFKKIEDIVEKLKSAQECMICLEKVVVPVYRAQCKPQCNTAAHIHQTCLLKWLGDNSLSNHCPNCHADDPLGLIETRPATPAVPVDNTKRLIITVATITLLFSTTYLLVDSIQRYRAGEFDDLIASFANMTRS